MTVTVLPSITETVLHDPWTPQNEMEECIDVVAVFKGEYLPIKKEVEVSCDSERIIAPGALSYNEVEVKPVFKDPSRIYSNQDQLKSYFKFMNDKLIYWTKATESGIAGKVVVSFIIDKNGKVTNVTSPVKIDVLSEEVERVVKLLPTWTPGSHGGKNVAVQCYVFVEFQICNTKGQTLNNHP